MDIEVLIMSSFSDPCEWCVATSSKIDSIEYEVEMLTNALNNLIGQLSVCTKPIDEDRIKAYLVKEYGVEL